jgi:hypothetical protein
LLEIKHSHGAEIVTAWRAYKRDAKKKILEILFDDQFHTFI